MNNLSLVFYFRGYLWARIHGETVVKVFVFSILYSHCFPKTGLKGVCFFSIVHLKTRLQFTGRLYQVEYAMEAIGHAGTCLGILANDGVLLAAERRNIHKLLDEVFFSEKIYKLNE